MRVVPFRSLVRTLIFHPLSLRSTLLAALSTTLSLAPALSAQAVDVTMVPRGHLRLQAHPVFTAWDSRFGLTRDGVESVESLGDDLTDPTTLSLFPGIPSMRNAIRSATGLGSYAPVLGATDGRVTQDVTRVDLGGHLGVTDWFTLGVVVPVTRNRTAIDVFFTPDLMNQNVGLNPGITDPGGTASFLTSAASAQSGAQAYATSQCAGGPSAGCTAAQDLSARTDAFATAMQTAYAASPFFPLAGSTAGDALVSTAASLSSDLTAAGLTGLAAVQLSAAPIAPEEFALIPTLAGAGIDAGAL